MVDLILVNSKSGNGVFANKEILESKTTRFATLSKSCVLKVTIHFDIFEYSKGHSTTLSRLCY